MSDIARYRRSVGRGARSAWEWVALPWHHSAVHRLRSAVEAGDPERLRALLAPTVAVVVDSGQEDRGARVVHGTHDAVALLAHGFASQDGILVQERAVNSQAGLMLVRSGRPIASVAVDFTGRLVSLVWVRLDPAALRHGNTVFA